MKIINLDLNKVSKSEEAEIIATFKKGQVVVMLTDTIYGFNCLADNDEAIKKIIKIKKRKDDKPFIILVSDLKMAEEYCFINQVQRDKLNNWWNEKRPTSVILKSRAKLATSLESYGSLALRLPKCDFFIKIIKKLGRPLVSTSFNFAGQALIDINSARELFIKEIIRPDLIINSGQKTSSKASRLIDGRSEKEMIIRK